MPYRDDAILPAAADKHLSGAPPPNSREPKLRFQHTALFPRAQFYSAIGSNIRRVHYEINRTHAICIGPSVGRSDERSRG